MRVFISHQKADSGLATSLAFRLKMRHQIDSYLDVIDTNLGRRGDALANSLRIEMGRCTQLLAVVSKATQGSWWVPWEIGIATEKRFPLATYADGPQPIPEYLQKWPYLKSDVELDLYAVASKTAADDLTRKRVYLTESIAQGSATDKFFDQMHQLLGR